MNGLLRCDGPPCPRCGCQDCTVHEWPKDGSQSWYASGRATCRHCGTHFAFKAAARPTVQEIPPAGDVAAPAAIPPAITIHDVPPMSRREPPNSIPINDRCPECGGESRVTSTRTLWRHRKCKECGHAFKSRKEGISA